MKQLAFLIIAVLAATSCKKKEEDNLYSTWYVNGQRFSTNKVSYELFQGVTTYLTGYDDAGARLFDFEFNQGDMRFSYDTAPLPSGHSHSFCAFLYQGKEYGPPFASFFDVHSIEHPGKFQFTIDTVWLYNYINLKKQDSVLVWGMFSQP